jgi:hypothetical protein
MPPAQARGTPILAWLLLGVFLASLICLIVAEPIVAVFLGVLWIILLALTWRSRVRVRRYIAGRNDTICSFARSFNLRGTDPWIIRATYEELLKYMKDIADPFPLKAEDRLQEDLEIDLEDLADIIIDIADRAGYDLSNVKRCHTEKVKTVGDLVRLVACQPRIEETEPNTTADGGG